MARKSPAPTGLSAWCDRNNEPRKFPGYFDRFSRSSFSEMPIADLGHEIDEGAHLGRQQPRCWVHEVDRQRWLLEFRQHDFEPASLKRLRCLIGHDLRQAAVLFGILKCGVGAVGGKTRRVPHPKLAGISDKAPV